MDKTRQGLKSRWTVTLDCLFYIPAKFNLFRQPLPEDAEHWGLERTGGGLGQGLLHGKGYSEKQRYISSEIEGGQGLLHGNGYSVKQR